MIARFFRASLILQVPLLGQYLLHNFRYLSSLWLIIRSSYWWFRYVWLRARSKRIAWAVTLNCYSSVLKWKPTALSRHLLVFSDRLSAILRQHFAKIQQNFSDFSEIWKSWHLSFQNYWNSAKFREKSGQIWRKNCKIGCLLWKSAKNAWNFAKMVQRSWKITEIWNGAKEKM